MSLNVSRIARAYGWLAVGVMAFAVYASLLPFRFEPMPLTLAASKFWTILLTPSLNRISRTNFLANVLLFVPIGFGLIGAFAADRALSPGALVRCVLLSVAVSLVSEFGQVFVPGRIPSAVDMLAQTLGCAIGIIAWTAIADDVSRWWRTTAHRTREDRFAKVLIGYAGAWIFVNLAPFDITLSPDTLGRRVHAGLINVVPFAARGLSPARAAWDVIASVLSAVPLGVLGLVWATGPAVRRGAASALGLAAALIVTLELAQIFIRSHAADATDVVSGWVGAAIGVWVGAHQLHRRAVHPSPASRRWSGAALATWLLVLCVYHWLPYDFTIDPNAVQWKLDRASLIPFAGYQLGSDLNAFNDLLVKLALSMPLGVIARRVLSSGPRLSRTAKLLWPLAAFVVFGIIEAGQLFLPSRVPDPTDIYVGVVGSCLGLALGQWMLGGGAAADDTATGSGV